VTPDRILAGTYTTGGGGGLFASTNGGAAWAPFGSGLPAISVWALTFTDADNGWLAASQSSTPRLYRTTNGGVSWSLLSATGLGGIAADLYFQADNLHGVAAIRTGTPGIYYTTDGGASWVPVSSQGAFGLSIRSDGIGVACGQFSSEGPRFTVDGGASWSPLEVPFAEAFDFFPSAITAALLTADGLLVGSSNNRILFGAEEGTVAVGDGSHAPMGGSLTLAGPGPNPFLNAMSVSYSLDRSMNVSLTVHDARGRLVATLEQGLRGAGSHVAHWDGLTTTGVRSPAGVYVVRVATPRGSLSRKVIRIE
jgi:hypothetical protein